MLTDKQREIFEKVLDTNWGVKDAIEQGRYDIAAKSQVELFKHKEELKESMGEVAYDNFMTMGRKMFQEKSE